MSSFVGAIALAAGLTLGSGCLVGVILGLIGGGGSILAVPLLVYVVGIGSAHIAIGTGATAVAFNAATSLIGHARAGTVKWRCAAVFAAAGVAGALAGSAAGKAMDGQRLLALFGLVMMIVGLSMLRPRRADEDAGVRLTAGTARRLIPRLAASGLVVGALSGFFGIGGGFLIVPGLMFATRMPLRNAIGTSLVAVSVFGVTTSASYAASGLVDWRSAILFIAGGIGGGYLGMKFGAALSNERRALNLVFSAVVITVGLFMTGKGLVSLLAVQAL